MGDAARALHITKKIEKTETSLMWLHASRDGLICSPWCGQKKYLSWKPEETMLDEYLGWMLAAMGVYFQVCFN